MIGADMCLGTRDECRQYPQFTLGPWTNAATLAIGSSLANYTAFNAEDPMEIRSRLKEGNIARRVRATFFRRLFEEFKLNIGIADDVVSIRRNDSSQSILAGLVGSGGGLPQLLKAVLATQIMYSWKINDCHINEGDYTGIRTGLLMWRFKENQIPLEY